MSISTVRRPATFSGRVAATALVALAALLVVAAPADAQQVTVPRVSPHASVSQTIGLTEVTVDYHRPLVNERPIWGALVPYGEVWRAGANENTTISFSHPVAIEGKPLAAGTYGLHMIPGRDRWQVAFSTNHTSWGSFSYDEGEDALRVEVTPGPAPHEEAMSYSFSDVGLDAATLEMRWEQVRVPVRITTDTHAIVLANAANELRSLPGFTWQGWLSAANYAFQQEIATDQALEWVDRSIGIQKNLQNLSLKARLLERAGRGEEAAQVVAEAERIAATELDVNALGYMFLQAGDVDKAIEVFRRNVADHPESWNVHDSLGEALAAKGDTAGAIANYSKALAMAPDAQKGRIEGVLVGLRQAE